MNEELFKDWFKPWKEVVDKYQVHPENPHNMDKKGNMLGVTKSVKVLVPSNAVTQFILSLGTQESVTIIKCVNGKKQCLLLFINWATKTHYNN